MWGGETMRNGIVAVVAAGIMSVCGCTWSQGGPKLEASSIRDTRAMVGTSSEECPATGGGPESVVVGGLLAAVAVPLIESLVKEAVGALGKAIEEAAKDKEQTVTAVAPGVDIVRARCIVLVRGVFGEAATSRGGNSRENLYDRLGLIGDPELYLEMPVFRNGREPSAFRVELQAMEYRRPLVSGITDSRDLVVSLVFQTPSKKSEKDEAAAFAIGGMNIEQIEVGSVLSSTGALKPGKTTAWLPIPGGAEKSDAARSDVQRTAAAKAGSTKPGTGLPGYGPYSIFVNVTETRRGSKFMQFLSGVFKPNEETIAKEGAKIVIELTGLQK